MNEKTLIGYHGTLKNKVQDILQNGFKPSISEENELEWLGDGIYFWEDDYYAVQWNIIDIERRHLTKNIENFNNYDIIESKLVVSKSKLFELSSPEGSIIYNNFKKKLTDKFLKAGLEEEMKELKLKSDKFWINLLEDNGFFDEFDIITAVYKNSKSIEKFKDDIVLNTQKQICVKNQKCIIKSEKYDDAERIYTLFKMIVERRSLVKK